MLCPSLKDMSQCQSKLCLTLDDVYGEVGGGRVVRSALPQAAVGGGDLLQQERHGGHLGLVHHQTDARLVGRHLDINIISQTVTLAGLDTLITVM